MTDTLTDRPRGRQVDPAEFAYADELAFLAAYDEGPRPPGWQLTPRAVVTFIAGSGGTAVELPTKARRKGLPSRLVIGQKFVGDRAVVERCVVTLAGERGLLLVGEPGTAKSMLSELLSAAVCGTSRLVVQGTAGTTEDQLRYGWNYALLLAHGPSPEALVPSPILAAMRNGAVARVEEITRCLPEVQDALVSILSDRSIAVPELSGTTDATVHAVPGFALIATANLRDRGCRRCRPPSSAGSTSRPSDPSPTSPRRSRSYGDRRRPPWPGRRPPSPSTTPSWRCSSPPSATCGPAGRWKGGTSTARRR